MGETTNKMNMGDWNEAQGSTAPHDDSHIAFASETTDEYEENTEQLRAEIEDTRADMSQTINEIQERLSPDHLMSQVKETVREATLGKVERVMERVGETIGEVTEPAREMAGRAGETLKETGRTVGNSVWRNPIPVALIGLGLGMIAMRTFRKGNGHDYQRPQRSSGLLSQTSLGGSEYGTAQYEGSRGYQSSRQYQSSGEYPGTTKRAVDVVRHTASNLASRSTHALSDLGTKAKDQATAVGSRFGEVLRENPLAVGAVAVAAGTAVGLILPSTRIESEYLRETSEMLVDKAEEAARGAIDKVQDVAHQAGAQQQAGGQQQPGMQHQAGGQQQQPGTQQQQ
jgi:ElaB/YqjD/DUF883 family membrane-anchored ribosome-binding protein